ncbi:hypothetical protein WJX72_004247 [[Myrmecia] bisecta]|uniref:[histone H3]-lysine(4) N-trimethyltransferase n=1 Tax=[Myrmecia] bisecta TaxID=41462 RepID=A0AAW1PPQ3_9CHLO
MHRFVVRRSSIAEQGVFTTEYVSAAEMIMEYVGELVRRPLSDIRERSYKRTGWGLYFFAIDADFVIDATMRGNMARYINHSCNPNCVAKLADVEGRRRVFIVSKHELAPGEELTYDYCLSSEQPNKSAWGDEHEPTSPRTAAIPCNCGATNCRGHL